MKLVSFTLGDERVRPGALLADGQRVLDFSSLPGSSAPAHELCERDGPFLRAARALHERTDRARDGAAAAVRPLTGVHLLAPVPRPGKIVCIGKNYREHADEMGATLPERPLVFSKFATSVSAPGAVVRIPRGCTRFDYEAELALVIGRRATRVPRALAREHVLGYCCFNDFTARDFQKLDGQWQRGKSADTLAPFGPYLATTDELPDPQRLRIRLRLNGATMQDAHTSLLIFGVDALIESISEHITLEPGDVIATGTPGGVGFARTPPVYLQPGDVVEVEIDGLGTLQNEVGASD